MARILGMKPRKLENWIAAGIIYPPTFIDKENTVNNWKGEEIPRKYYSYKEVVAIRTLMKGRVFARRKVIPEEFIDKVHSTMERIRNQLKDADIALMDYPLILEFENQKDAFKYLCKFLKKEEAENLVKSLYLKGNKILEVVDERKKVSTKA